MHALKLKLLENRCTIKHAFSHIFIRIQVGYMVKYIDILKSYLNLNKYMTIKRVLWCIYFQVLGFKCMHPSTRYYGKENIIFYYFFFENLNAYIIQSFVERTVKLKFVIKFDSFMPLFVFFQI